jgi:hypothetical protein
MKNLVFMFLGFFSFSTVIYAQAELKPKVGCIDKYCLGMTVEAVKNILPADSKIEKLPDYKYLPFDVGYRNYMFPERTLKGYVGLEFLDGVVFKINFYANKVYANRFESFKPSKVFVDEKVENEKGLRISKKFSEQTQTRCIADKIICLGMSFDEIKSLQTASLQNSVLNADGFPTLSSLRVHKINGFDVGVKTYTFDDARLRGSVSLAFFDGVLFKIFVAYDEKFGREPLSLTDEDVRSRLEKRLLDAIVKQNESGNN